MDLNMREVGETVISTDLDDYFMEMEMYMMANGVTIGRKVMGSILTLMVRDMREVG